MDFNAYFHSQVMAEIEDRKEREENRGRMGRMEADRDNFLEQIKQERREANLVSKLE